MIGKRKWKGKLILKSYWGFCINGTEIESQSIRVAEKRVKVTLDWRWTKGKN